jgi:hypoxia up-regulated 1
VNGCSGLLLLLSWPTHSFMKIFGLRNPPKPAFVPKLQEKKRVHRKALTVETYYVGKVQPLSEALVQEYKGNLAELARRDNERIALEEAKNKLESYFYLINNRLMDDEDNIAKISTAEQREELSTLSREAEEWLFDEGDKATLEALKSKLEVLMVPAEKVWFRLKESKARPAAVKAMREKLTSIEENFTKWVSEMTHITEEEQSDVLEKIEGVRKWLSDKEGEQDEKAPHEDPVFASDEVPLQIQPIQKLVAKLSKKPLPKVKKNATEEKVAEEAGNETSTSNSTDKGNSTEAPDADSEDKEQKKKDDKEDKTTSEEDDEL